MSELKYKGQAGTDKWEKGRNSRPHTTAKSQSKGCEKIGNFTVVDSTPTSLSHSPFFGRRDYRRLGGVKLERFEIWIW